MRKSFSKASGRNDAWFAAACIVGLAGLGLCSEAKAQDVSANVAVTSVPRSVLVNASPDEDRIPVAVHSPSIDATS